jgi:6-phospho-beta-glucosidase
LLTDDGAHHYVDVRNDATIAGLSDDVLVEVPALVGRDGARPLPVAPLAPELFGLVQAVTCYEELAIQAAGTGSRTVATRALLANPLVRQWDLAVPMLDEILAAKLASLPGFAAQGAPRQNS